MSKPLNPLIAASLHSHVLNCGRKVGCVPAGIGRSFPVFILHCYIHTAHYCPSLLFPTHCFSHYIRDHLIAAPCTHTLTRASTAYPQYHLEQPPRFAASLSPPGPHPHSSSQSQTQQKRSTRSRS